MVRKAYDRLYSDGMTQTQNLSDSEIELIQAKLNDLANILAECGQHDLSEELDVMNDLVGERGFPEPQPFRPNFGPRPMTDDEFLDEQADRRRDEARGN